MSKLSELLAAKTAANAAKAKSETINVTVLDIVPQKPAMGADGIVYPRVRVVTLEQGSIFMFESQVSGALPNYGKNGVAANATMVLNSYVTKKDQVDATGKVTLAAGSNVDDIQFNRLVITGLDPKIAAMAALGAQFVMKAA